MNNNDYFASMNTGNGFKSYFDTVFDPQYLEALFIIKGGSGTGKSTMMKRIGEEAERNKQFVEYFHCSSDCDSLDGIIINDKIAVIDGTAPHTTDPKYPGAVDTIINLNECLDSNQLKKYKSEIIQISVNKSSYYRKGYSFLSAASQVKKEITSMTKTGLEYYKMQGAIERFFKQNGYVGSGKDRRVRLISGVCPGGKMTYSTFEKNSERICIIINAHGCEGIFFEAFLEHAEKLGLKCCLSYDPLCPDVYNALYFPENKLSVVCAAGDENLYDDKYKVFNMERFLSKDSIACTRVKERFASKCIKALVEGATDSFTEAKKSHLLLESIYRKAVDFERVENITSKLSDNIINQL